jgi:hypothetical protein
MARDAAGGDLAVRSLRFGGVTVRARLLHDSAVGFVAVRAGLMSRGRGLVFFFVTVPARCGLCAGVRFVALGAALVAGLRGGGVLAGVAGLAADLRELRTMR